MTRKELLEKYALKAWKEDILLNGSMSGGIGPVKQMISLTVTDENTVKINYDYPETCGLSDVRYHVTDHDLVRTDVFDFSDNTIKLNGKPFPDPVFKEFLHDEELEDADRLAEKCSEELRKLDNSQKGE